MGGRRIVLVLLRDSMAASSTTRPWLFPIVLLATVAALFAGSVGPGLVFAFRDSLHFYPPLYRLVADEWLAGRVPLWNPLANCGQPLAGMGSAGAFYLPQILLTMLLPDGTSLNVYCILHLALAATGAYLLARDQGCSRPAATVAGLAYAFGGSVLGQVYNPIYAAGAAWLAWAMYAGLRLVQGRGGPRDFVLLAAALAMCVFCGDPQAAYHAGLVLGLFWLVLPGRSWKGFGMLAAAGLAGGLLSLVQVALAAEFTRDTQRSMDLAPYSLWEIPAYLAHRAEIGDRAAWYDIFIGRPRAAAGHYGAIYAFALHPLRLLEFIWPDALGTIAGRWAANLRLDNGEVWANSLYSGILPLVLAAAAWIARAARWPTRRAWGLVAALALVASMGGLGLVGIVRNAAMILMGDVRSLGYAHGDEVGGLYWALSIGLPGYAGFRYPVKWMTVFALALGQLAAMGFDGLGDAGVRARCRAVAGTIAAVLAVVLAGLGIAALVHGAAHVLPAGSLEARRVAIFQAVFQGGVHALVFAAGTGFLLRERFFEATTPSPSLALRASRHRGWPSGITTALLALLFAADLALAGRRELVVEPIARLVAGGNYLDELASRRRPDMATVASRPRLAVVDPASILIDPLDMPRYVWEVGQTLIGHTPWFRGQEKIGERSTAMSRELEFLLCPLEHEGRKIVSRRTYDLCGVEFFIVGAGEAELTASSTLLHEWSAEQQRGAFEGPVPLGPPLPAVPIMNLGPNGGEPLMVVARNESALPRVRVVRQVATVPPASKRDWSTWIDLLKRIAFPNREIPDLFHAAIIEGEALDGPPFPQGGRAAVRDACRMVVDEPQRVVIEADLATPGLVVVADSWHPDWTVSVSSDGGPPRAAPIRRANRIHRGVGLPAGRHVLEFRYRSKTFVWTAPLTLAAWAAAAVAVAASFRSGLTAARHGAT
jgi:hypothetical protein